MKDLKEKIDKELDFLNSQFTGLEVVHKRASENDLWVTLNQLRRINTEIKGTPPVINSMWKRLFVKIMYLLKKVYISLRDAWIC